MRTTVLRWALSTVAFGVVDHVVWFLGFLLIRPLYIDARLYPVWSNAFLDLLKNAITWQTIVWVVVMGLITGLLYTATYRFLRDRLEGGLVKKALLFSSLTFGTGVLHSLMGGVTMLYIPLGLMAAWTGVCLIGSVATSFTLAVVNKK